MKPQIIQKAFHVWHEGMIGYGPEIANSVDETEIVYASTPGKAKSKASEWSFWQIDGQDPSYIDLKCRRAKGADLVVFEGKEVERYLIDSILLDRKREAKLNSFLNDDTLTHCYICKHGLYYKPNSIGYSNLKQNAGLYTIQEGVSHAISCSELWLERTNVEDHNKLLNEAIKKLQESLIQ